MTSLPAEKLRLKNKGRITENYDADITIFNLDTVIDNATYENPRQFPSGIEWVIVNGQVVVEFIDTGRGMNAETIKQIFDPGFTTKGSGVGTGLGLSIVHQIIEAHHGRIEVVSEPGRGSTIRLTLPVDPP